MKTNVTAEEREVFKKEFYRRFERDIEPRPVDKIGLTQIEGSLTGRLYSFKELEHTDVRPWEARREAWWLSQREAADELALARRASEAVSQPAGAPNASFGEEAISAPQRRRHGTKTEWSWAFDREGVQVLPVGQAYNPATAKAEGWVVVAWTKGATKDPHEFAVLARPTNLTAAQKAAVAAIETELHLEYQDARGMSGHRSPAVGLGWGVTGQNLEYSEETLEKEAEQAVPLNQAFAGLAGLLKR